MALLEKHRTDIEGLSRIDLPATEAETLRRLQDFDVPLKLHWEWDYRSSEEMMRSLYEKGKAAQWNARTDIDWSIPLDDGDWFASPDTTVVAGTLPVIGADEETQRQAVIDEFAYSLSQLLHGEQAALELTAQLVNALPDMDSKLYAASQVVDEARHVEVFALFLTDKYGEVFEVDPAVKYLLDVLLGADTWFKKAVGMQILFEGTALGIFAGIEQNVRHPLVKDIIRRVVVDEARHAAFGVHSLKRHMPALSSAERADLEDFAFEVLECLFAAGGKNMVETLAPRYGLDPDRLLRGMIRSPAWRMSQAYVYGHTVLPSLETLGLLTERTRPGYVSLGLLEA